MIRLGFLMNQLDQQPELERHRRYLRQLCAEILARLEEPPGLSGDPLIRSLVATINDLELAQRLGFAAPPIRYDRDTRSPSKEVHYWAWFDPAGGSCAIPFCTVERSGSDIGEVRYFQQGRLNVWQQLVTPVRRWIRALDGMASGEPFCPRLTPHLSSARSRQDLDPFVRAASEELARFAKLDKHERFRIEDEWRGRFAKLSAIAKYDMAVEFNLLLVEGLVGEQDWRVVARGPGASQVLELPIAPDHCIETKSVVALARWLNEWRQVRAESLAATVGKRGHVAAAHPGLETASASGPLPKIEDVTAIGRTTQGVSGARTLVVPRKRRGRPETPVGWIYLNDAAEKYGIAKSTLHDCVNELGAGDKLKDHDAGQVRVREAPLRDLLRKKGRATD